MAIFQGVAEEKNIQLAISAPNQVFLVGDPQKLIQVLNNLIDNAIKFSPAGGRVEIVLACPENQVDFRISNPGHVPDGKLERIFERFYQVDPSRNRESLQGNGLGLSICKSIIQLHGGSISAATHGDRFEVRFEIPVEPV